MQEPVGFLDHLVAARNDALRVPLLRMQQVEPASIMQRVEHRAPGVLPTPQLYARPA